MADVESPLFQKSQMLQPGSPSQHITEHAHSMRNPLNPNSYQHQRGKRKQPRALRHQSQKTQQSKLPDLCTAKSVRKEHREDNVHSVNIHSAPTTVKFEDSKQNQQEADSFDGVWGDDTKAKDVHSDRDRDDQKGNHYATDYDHEAPSSALRGDQEMADFTKMINCSNDRLPGHNGDDGNDCHQGPKEEHHPQIPIPELMDALPAEDGHQRRDQKGPSLQVTELHLSGIFDKIDIEMANPKQYEIDILNLEADLVDLDQESNSTAPILFDSKHRGPEQVDHRRHRMEQQISPSNIKRVAQSPPTVTTPSPQRADSRRPLQGDARSQNIKQFDGSRPRSGDAESVGSFYLHPNGRKMSEESFKMLQQLQQEIESMKKESVDKVTQSKLSKWQRKLLGRVRIHMAPPAHSEDEKMSSVLNGRGGISPPAQSPQSYGRNANAARPKTKRRGAGQHTPRHKTTAGRHRSDRRHGGGTRLNVVSGSHNHYSFNINNHTVISDANVGESRETVRRQLHFDNDTESRNQELMAQCQRMSVQQIMQRQERKLRESHEEMDNLHEELNMVYEALDRARLGRARLYQKVKETEAECFSRIRGVHQDFSKFKLQTSALHKDLWDVANDDRLRRKHERSLRKSKRKMSSRRHQR